MRKEGNKYYDSFKIVQVVIKKDRKRKVNNTFFIYSHKIFAIISRTDYLLKKNLKADGNIEGTKIPMRVT